MFNVIVCKPAYARLTSIDKKPVLLYCEPVLICDRMENILMWQTGTLSLEYKPDGTVWLVAAYVADEKFRIIAQVYIDVRIRR